MTVRNLRVAIGDGEPTVHPVRRGDHVTVGDPGEFARTYSMGERDAPVWCTLTVHAPEAECVSVMLSPAKAGRPPLPAANRRSVYVRVRLTPVEAAEAGLAGADRHELARARLLTPETELAELFSVRTSPVPVDVQRLCVAGELASRAAPRVIRELCRRLAEAEARRAGSPGAGS